MGKSGLFTDYLIKMAQVITWFSLDEGSGFTYWPEGPLKAPKRVLPPIYNRGVVVQNEMMVHRGEANGPLDYRSRPGWLSTRCSPATRPIATSGYSRTAMK